MITSDQKERKKDEEEEVEVMNTSAGLAAASQYVEDVLRSAVILMMNEE